MCVWYPFKFRGSLSYSTLSGVLADELRAPPSTLTWKRRRRWRLALRHNPGFLAAKAYPCARSVVEGWTDTPDHHFRSVILRSETADGVSVWTETRHEHGGHTMFRLEAGQSSTRVECRSGPMVGWSTTIEGRTVKVLHPERLPPDEVALDLVPVRSITDTWT